jgi:DNA-binding GntR family transcriptional regulator
MTKIPTQGMTLASQVAEILQEKIITGEIKPGERVFQDVVAKELGVSRIPVRLALEVLQNRGLLVLNPHRGAKVTELSIEELKEIFEVRAFIEGMAIEKSLPNLTEKDLDECEQCITQMKELNDSSLWIELNKKFHRILYSQMHSSAINNLISSLRENTERYVRMVLTLTNRFDEYDEEHEAILEACKKRDIRKARICMETHLRNTLKVLEKHAETKG